MRGKAAVSYRPSSLCSGRCLEILAVYVNQLRFIVHVNNIYTVDTNFDN